MDILKLASAIQPVDENAVKRAYARWDDIAKPLRSLGILEDLVARIAGISGDVSVDISKRCVAIMCADNGVVAQGVTQSDSSVTAVISGNFVKGITTVCTMAKFNNADIIPVDIGIDCDVIEGMMQCKIMRGTNDMSLGPAMSRQEAVRAVQVGIDVATDLARQGYKLIATGEMGIGNTTPSSAVASVLFDKSAEEVTGKGAGLDSTGLQRKIEVVKKSIEINKPDASDPLDIISKVGSLDIAGMAGLFIGGASMRVPVMIDGFISGISACLAARLNPLSKDYMIPSHVSAEPAACYALHDLGFSPIVTAGMRLGEGTGAMAALALIDMAIEVYKNTATFSGINIENYVHLH